MTMKLQGIGEVQSQKASSLKVGDRTVWNHGLTNIVTRIDQHKSGKTMVVEFDGKYVRRMSTSRDVCIA